MSPQTSWVLRATLLYAVVEINYAQEAFVGIDDEGDLALSPKTGVYLGRRPADVCVRKTQGLWFYIYRSLTAPSGAGQTVRVGAMTIDPVTGNIASEQMQRMARAVEDARDDGACVFGISYFCFALYGVL